MSSKITIHSLLFITFRDIILTGDLSLLGDGESEALQATWKDLLAEYSAALGSSDSDGYLSDRIEFIYFQNQRTLINGLIEVIAPGIFRKSWAIQLGKIVGMTIRVDTMENILEDLKTADVRARGLVDIHIQALSDKLEEYNKKQEGSKEQFTPSLDYFAEVLLNLHSFHTHHWEDDKISTYQYCSMVRRYNQHVAYLQSKSAA